MPATRLAKRVLARLAQAEVCESNPHYRDDLRIARLAVAYAAKGEAVLCSPHVLASYAVLGLHPEKVWPAIQARRKALGPVDGWDAPVVPVPKKPVQSASLWPEKTNGARAVNSCAGDTLLRDNTNSVPMAAPSITTAYPNSDAPSSGKRGEYFYDEAIRIIKRSGAPDHVRQLTLDALAVRGDWPKRKGPITNIITVSIRSLQDEGGVYRSTIQRRIRRATQEKYWRELHPINHWLNCPKCGAERESAQCPKCPHKGNGHNPDEFRTTITHAIDFEKFERTPPCRQVREIRELRARHSPKGVAQMPPREERESVAVKQPAAEPAHRSTEKPRTVVHTEISVASTKAAQLLMEMCGLADIGAIPQIAISIAAEAKYRGIEIEEAAKLIADCCVRDQKKGIALTRFYFRDLKWRASDGGQTSAAAQRADHNKRAILDGFAANARDRDVPDSS